MIKVVIIAPYQELEPVIQEVIHSYECAEAVSASVYVRTSRQLEGAMLQGDVIIARGYTLESAKRRFPETPVLPLTISGYDVVRAVLAGIQRFGAKKIAFVGAYEMVCSAENVSGLLGAEVKSYHTDTEAEFPASIEKARQEGCDCFAGGLNVKEHCGEIGYPCVMIETGRSAILACLDEAVRTVQLLREQRERSLRYKTILDYSREGVAALGEDGTIHSINSAARSYLGLREHSIGQPFGRLVPFAAPMVERALASGEILENEVSSLSDRLFSLDYIPVKQGRQIMSLVVFIRSVDRIQKEEALIRKKIQSHGQKAKYHFADILYRSSLFKKAVERARLYAAVDSPVLIVGESGTGKELMAQSIHNESPRSGGPFIAINCAALPENLLESELFGYSDGAFTGALKGGREGLFEAAHGGTIFLDEISEIPISFQSKLLRVLQENEVRRIGSQKVRSIDVRVIAATNRDLNAQVQKGLFRQDLLFRLNVLYLYIPPLRQRPEDIEDLFMRYLKEFCGRYGKDISLVTPEARALLARHGWGGNVRELKNIAERLCVLNRTQTVEAAAVKDALCMDGMEGACAAPWEEGGAEAPEAEASDEEGLIRLLLQRHQGNRAQVARRMGIDRTTLWRKMKKYGIR